MKRALLSLAVLILVGSACLPGQAENGSCNTTPDCQAHLVCLGQACLGGASDAGLLCKFECTTNADCPNGETCQGAISYCLHCDLPSAVDAG